MPSPSTQIEIFRLLPSQAADFAGPMQGFLRAEFEGLYVRELGIQMIILADPTDTKPGGKVDKQYQRIMASTDLGVPDTSAYLLARDPNEEDFAGIVGLAKFTRNDDHEVEIEELDVALDRRGEGIATRMLDHALGTLAVSSADGFILDVLKGNRVARRYWGSINFRYSGRRHHHDYAFPNPADYHLEMIATHKQLQDGVQARLSR